MTALEYMKKQVEVNKKNYNRECERGASADALQNIKNKIRYYEEAVKAMEKQT